MPPSSAPPSPPSRSVPQGLHPCPRLGFRAPPVFLPESATIGDGEAGACGICHRRCPGRPFPSFLAQVHPLLLSSPSPPIRPFAAGHHGAETTMKAREQARPEGGGRGGRPGPPARMLMPSRAMSMEYQLETDAHLVRNLFRLKFLLVEADHQFLLTRMRVLQRHLSYLQKGGTRPSSCLAAVSSFDLFVQQGGDPAFFTSHATRVIDADYRSPMGVVLFNHLEVDFAMKPGDRVTWMIVHVIATPEVAEVEDLDAIIRGEGGFGSAGV